MTPLRCAVVGVGYLGRFHAEKYASLPDCQLVGVCDVNEAQSREVADRLQVPAFADYRELIGQVDAVTIATPTSTHFEVALFFLNNGVHVNLEKPMAASAREARHLCEVAKQRDLRLQVGHVERFNPAFVAAREKLHEPLFIECHRLAPFKPRGVDVSVVLDLMIHDLDVILSLINGIPTKVEAVGTPVITDQVDIANARIEFSTGAVANVTASRVSLSAQRKFRVFQRDQYVSIDFGAGEIRMMTRRPGSVGLNDLSQDSWNLEKGDALLAETGAFVNSVRTGTECVVTGEDGLKALELAEKIGETIASRPS